MTTRPLVAPFAYIPLHGADADDDVDFVALEATEERMQDLLSAVDRLRERSESVPTLLSELHKDHAGIAVLGPAAMSEEADPEILEVYHSLQAGPALAAHKPVLADAHWMRVYGTTQDVSSRGVAWDIQVDGSHYRTPVLSEALIVEALLATAPEEAVSPLFERLVDCAPARASEVAVRGLHLPGGTVDRNVMPLLASDALLPLLESKERAVRERASTALGRGGPPKRGGR